MFSIENIRQGIVAVIAAAILTTVSVGAAVGPARAIETAPSASIAA
ncbi:MAG: hypothetical protein QOJ94_1973 [Sphingomonadales bacterium]|jgi:hypothetical protein|nr:hypothetical protein [Sphingomonadales bacterium]